MLKGDLVSTPLPEVLRQLADGVASGCLNVMDGIGEQAKVFLRGGQVYAVQVPGRRPQLGARLVSSGSLGPEALAEALEAQRTELQGWRLGELLVHLGYVDQPVVEAFIKEQVREQTSDLMRWPTGTWKFRVNERTREDVAPPTPVETLLQEVSHRMAEWETIAETVHGPDAVPALSAAGQSDAEMAIDPEAWSLLCKVDGSRSIAELARECGFTLFEAGQVVYSLVRSGLLEVEEILIGAEEISSTGSVASRLAAAFAPDVAIPAQAEEPTPAEVASLLSAALRVDRPAPSARQAPVDEDEIEGSIGRVSAALSALLGPTIDESLFDAPKPRTPKVKPPTQAELDRAAKKAEKAARDARRREQDAAELAAAQAELEAARSADVVTYGADHEAQIVNLEEVRREAARRDESEAAEAEAARLAEQARLAAEAEAARLAAEAEAEAVRLAEEEAARVAAEAEALRLAEEQAAAEAEEERLAEEERVAAEAEAARLAEEERLAAEAEAARLAEEERLAAEAEAARLAEEERLAAEAEAARLAEEERLAAEAEAARLAEEERLAAEAEAARLAEDERLAAEAEAARFAAEAEAARLAEEQAAAEAARVTEEEARRAAEDEAARLAQEQATAEAAAAERALAEEELRRAAEEQAAAEATRLAEEQAAAAAAEEARRTQEQADADAEHDEQVRLTAQRANATDAFAELSATAASSSDVQVLEAEAPPVADDIDDEPLPTYGSPDTDMASLFRELSSLGMEDEPAPAPSRPASTPPRPPAAAPPAKKKKGLFGR